MCEHGSSIYDSVDMRKGLDKAKLLASKDMLGALLRLDHRGGLFSNADLNNALIKSFSDSPAKVQMIGKAHQEKTNL